MGLMERPEVKSLDNGGKYWEHEYDSFYLKVYVPATDIDGKVNNYGFRAPFLLVFEEERKTAEDAVRFAEDTGLARLASEYDASVLFVYPTCEGGWENAEENVYIDLIAETKNHFLYDDGIAPVTDFFAQEFKGFFIRGAIFRADIYSYGKSADYVASKLLKKIDGEYLWGPGEITPACCSMERLSVVPQIERRDIAILSVGNSDDINKAFEGCENLLIKGKAEYIEDFKSFVWKYKMWCGHIELEPDFDTLGIVEDAGYSLVKTSPDNRGIFKDEPEHKVGYFAYYNTTLFDKGPVPLMIGFHGGGDSSMYLTFVSGWWEIAHDEDFLFVSLENHQDVTATEVVQVIEDLKQKYDIDEKRIYATGFSMGCGKTWDMYHEYPEIFAGFCPASALFPIKDNPFGLSLGDPKLNMSVAVPFFYSGGENSHLPELPCHADTALDRIKYLAEVNKLAADFDLSFEDKENWKDEIYGAEPDKVEKVANEERDSILTIRYYNSTDGKCRTALASVSNQVHECRQHTCREAWKFISQFVKK